MTPSAGVLPGTRFTPLIWMKVFCEIFGAVVKAGLTDVMVDFGAPAAGTMMVPVPFTVMADWLTAAISVAEPVAPANMPVPPITVLAKVTGLWFAFSIRKKSVKESLGLKVKTAVPWLEISSVLEVVTFIVTLPKGATVPVAVTELLPTFALAASESKAHQSHGRGGLPGAEVPGAGK